MWVIASVPPSRDWSRTCRTSPTSKSAKADFEVSRWPLDRGDGDPFLMSLANPLKTRYVEGVEGAWRLTKPCSDDIISFGPLWKLNIFSSCWINPTAKFCGAACVVYCAQICVRHCNLMVVSLLETSFALLGNKGRNNLQACICSVLTEDRSFNGAVVGYESHTSQQTGFKFCMLFEKNNHSHKSYPPPCIGGTYKCM